MRQKETEVFFLEKAGAVMEFTSQTATTPSYVTNSGQPYGSINQGKFAYWGSNNLLPEDLIKLVYGNDLKPNLIKKRVNFNCGKGPITYKEEIAEGKRKKVYVLDPVIEDFLKKSDYKKLMRSVDTDLEMFNNAFVEFVLTKGKKVSSMRKLDATNVRAELIDEYTGRINNYFLSADWKSPKKDRIIQVPSFDPEYPKYNKKFILHIREEQSGQPYYAIPNWIGSKDATEVAETIWKFHKAGLKNGYALRYHIKIPSAYFNQFPEPERERRKADLRDSMNNWLAGAENAGKALVSYLEHIPGQVNPSEWKIDTISADLKDTAFSVLFEQSTISNAQSHGIHPTLAGVILSGSLGSGSEIRTLYHSHIALETNEPRDMIFEPITKVVAPLNGWDKDIKFGVEDIELTSLDQNPTGQNSAIK